MERRPNHRGKYCGKDERSRYYHLNKLFMAVATLRDLLAAMRPQSRGLYSVEPGVVLRARAAVDDALPYLADDEGRVRL